MALLFTPLLGWGLGAATLEVTQLHDPGLGSLRDTLALAAPGDTVRVTASGVLTLTAGPVLLEKDAVIEGPGADALTVSGADVDRVLWVGPGVRVRLSGMTVAGGRHMQGGAFYNDRGTVELDDCVFRANRALGSDATPGTGQPGMPAWGGAVYNTGELTARDSTFTDNRASGGQGGSGYLLPANDPEVTAKLGGVGGSGAGGAIFNGGVLRLDRVLLSMNEVSGGAGGTGASPTNLTPSTAASAGKGGRGGEAWGGALYNGGTASLLNVTLALNMASGGEAGDHGVNTNLPLSSGGRSGTFGAPGCGYGGAIYNLGSLALTNVTCATNLALRGLPYSASYRADSTPEVLPGGGLWTLDKATVFANTVLAGNTTPSADLVDANCYGSVLDTGHNLSSDATPTFVLASSANNVDPGLLPLADNGGPTATFALSRGSAALDAGDDSLAPPVDQRGVVRPAGAASDIGAFEGELPNPLLVVRQPEDQYASEGMDVWFSIEIAGYPSPQFQWQKDGVDLPGETNAVLGMWVWETRKEETYRVRAWNRYGALVSEPARLIVVPTLPWVADCLNTASVGTNLSWRLPWFDQSQWFPQAEMAHDGVCALRCATVEPYSSELAARVWAPGRVSFWWRSTQPRQIQCWARDGTLPLGNCAVDQANEWEQATLDVAPGVDLSWNVLNIWSDWGTVAWLAEVSFEPGWFPPTVTMREANVTATASGSATLASYVSGTPLCTYRWYFGEDLLVGATNGYVILKNVQAANAGVYRVVVDNPVGSATNQTALAVNPVAPSFTLKPWNLAVLPGEAATFRAAVSGSEPFTYQWYLNGTPVDGGLGPVLTIPNVGSADLGSYQLVVRNPVGQVTNSPAALSLAVPLADALDTPDLVWSNLTALPWAGQTAVAADGVDAAWATTGFEKGTNRLATTVVGPGTLSFRWRAGLQSSGNVLRLLVDDVVIASGTYEDRELMSDWHQRRAFLGVGVHTVIWELQVVYSYTPCQVWLDTVEFVQGGVVPTATLTPADLTVPAGLPVALQAQVDGTPPIALQWYCGATPVAGATNADLVLAAIRPDEAGPYVLEAANAFGTRRSAPAMLGVSASFAEALGTPGWRWTTSTSPLFRTQNTVTHDGVSAVQAGMPAYGAQPATLTTTVAGPAALEFWLMMSCVNAGGSLVVTVDGKTALSYAGEFDWQRAILPIDVGVHEVSWSLSHGGGPWSETELFWLDDVRLIPGGVAPSTRAVQPFVSVTNGFPAVMKVKTAGTGPFEYLWTREGGPIPWAHSATLILPAVQTADTGGYDVFVRNEYGAAQASFLLGIVVPLAESVECTNSLSVSPSGSKYWFGQTAVSHDGHDAGQSGATDYGTVSFFTRYTGPGTLTYWWKTMCRAGVDRLSVQVGSLESAALSGDTDWQMQTLYLPTGTRTVTWSYGRAYENDGLFNAGWVDEIDFRSGGTAPLLVQTPASQSAFAGANVSYQASAIGTPPLAYFWMLGDQRLNAQTTSTSLQLANVQASAAYTLIVTNAYGAVTNSFQLAVHPIDSHPAAARLEHPAYAAGRGFSMDLVVEPGWWFLIQASSNLADWVEVERFFSVEPVRSWQEPASPGGSSRYYRIVGP